MWRVAGLVVILAIPPGCCLGVGRARSLPGFEANLASYAADLGSFAGGLAVRSQSLLQESPPGFATPASAPPGELVQPSRQPAPRGLADDWSSAYPLMATDAGVLGKELSAVQRSVELEEFAGIMDSARSQSQTDLESTVSTASQAANALAHDAAALSQELGKLTVLLRGSGSFSRSMPAQPMSLMNWAVNSSRPMAAKSAHGAVPAGVEGGPMTRPTEQPPAPPSSTTKIASDKDDKGDDDDKSYTGFLKYLTVDSRLPLYPAIILWGVVALVLFCFFPWCCCRMRRH